MEEEEEEEEESSSPTMSLRVSPLASAMTMVSTMGAHGKSASHQRRRGQGTHAPSLGLVNWPKVHVLQVLEPLMLLQPSGQGQHAEGGVW